MWSVEAGRVIGPEGILSPGYVQIEGQRVVAVRAGAASSPTHRFPDGILAPGFIDLQVNGCAGVDFLSVPASGALAPAARHLARSGVTAFLPTLISAPAEQTRRALRILAEAAPTFRPRILGIHLEGPFLNPDYRGAHDRAFLRPPDRAHLRAMLEMASGLVRLCTLAPELKGAGELIEELRTQEVVVAAGHTGAGFTEARRAFAQGVGMVTHLFNAMRPFHHREPGIVGAALMDTSVAAGVILDGVHLHPATAALALRVLGPDRAVLVTDSVAAAGRPPGEFLLGGRRVTHDERAVRLTDGTLAGSVVTMPMAVAAAIEAGVQLEDVVRMASTTPARVLGLDDRGRLAAGALADLVVLDRDLTVAMTVCEGVVLYGPDGPVETDE